MNQHPVQLQIERADKAIVAEDFDVLMDIYTDNAVLVIEPGRNAVGKSEIRKAFEAIAVYFKNGLQVEQNGMEIPRVGRYSFGASKHCSIGSRLSGCRTQGYIRIQ
ncbi:MAG: hypothetical protein AB7S90_03430 [Marinobacterium sp.]